MTQMTLVRHLVWKGYVYVSLFSPSDIKYHCKKYSKLFQRTFAAEGTSTKRPLFHRSIQTCGKLLLVGFFFLSDRCHEAL